MIIPNATVPWGNGCAHIRLNVTYRAPALALSPEQRMLECIEVIRQAAANETIMVVTGESGGWTGIFTLVSWLPHPRVKVTAFIFEKRLLGGVR